MNLETAINSPRVHNQLIPEPNVVEAEGNMTQVFKSYFWLNFQAGETTFLYSTQINS